MASRQEHNFDGRKAWEKKVGREATEEEIETINIINARLDQFAHFPDMAFLVRHRKFLHHAQGIEYFTMKYGELGEVVATRHIRMDCSGQVPMAEDYYNGNVDEFGILTGSNDEVEG